MFPKACYQETSILFLILLKYSWTRLYHYSKCCSKMIRQTAYNRQFWWNLLGDSVLHLEEEAEFSQSLNARWGLILRQNISSMGGERGMDHVYIIHYCFPSAWDITDAQNGCVNNKTHSTVFTLYLYFEQMIIRTPANSRDWKVLFAIQENQ